MDEKVRHIDLCSGIGGFALAAGWAGAATGRDVRTVAFCEIDPFCQAVLAHHWPGVPIYDDIKTFDYEGGCDLITAGYPCQPFSVAGKQKGAADDRHLWPSVFEILKRKRPAWALFENVPGHITLGLDEVLLDLESEGYAARPVVIPACAVDAPHRRDRVWIVGHTTHDRRNWGAAQAGRKRTTGEPEQPGPDVRREPGGSSANVADTDGRRCTGRREHEKQPYQAASASEAVADAASAGLEVRASGEVHKYSAQQRSQRCGEDVADTKRVRQPGPGQSVRPRDTEENQNGKTGGADYGSQGRQGRWSLVEPMGDQAHGIPGWVAGDWERGVPRVEKKEEMRKEKLTALGNSVVPQVAAEILEAMFRNWDHV